MFLPAAAPCDGESAKRREETETEQEAEAEEKRKGVAQVKV